MAARILSKDNAEHYTWGGPNRTDCDGWHLVRSEQLSVIEERMPAGTSEVRHFHQRARQFFYVIEGELTMDLEDEQVVIRAGEGIEISPGQRHQAINRGLSTVRMLVVSQPPSHGDRLPA